MCLRFFFLLNFGYYLCAESRVLPNPYHPYHAHSHRYRSHIHTSLLCRAENAKLKHCTKLYSLLLSPLHKSWHGFELIFFLMRSWYGCELRLNSHEAKLPLRRWVQLTPVICRCYHYIGSLLSEPKKNSRLNPLTRSCTTALDKTLLVSCNSLQVK